MEFGQIAKFKEKSVLVIGDVMIDRYEYGQTTRISPEAPVPVVRVTHEENTPGGAGNVARNLSTLGGKIFIAGVCGKDKDAAILKKQLGDCGIDTSLLIEDETRPTTVKKRIISGNNYQLMRLDYEKTSELPDELKVRFQGEIQRKIKNFDAIIFSDYSKGLITQDLASMVIAEAKKSKIPVLADTKPEHIHFFKGCALVTPNLKEAMEMTGEQDIPQMGRKLVEMLGCEAFITRGAEGISVFDRKSNHTHVPPISVTKVFDVTGAGDTVIAVAALCLASGMDIIESAKLANHAAGIVVQKPGTSTTTPEELMGVFRNEISHYLQESIDVKQKVIAMQIDKIEKAARMFIDAYKRGGKVIAFGNGGSASDAQHLVGELVGRFRAERKGLSAIALTTDSAVVTAIANDFGYDMVFERQIEANAMPGDVVIGISTSGNSKNVINALEKARQIGCKTIALTGKEGGKMAGMCDVDIIVPSDNTPRIQEAHISIIHIICELLDKSLQKHD